MLIKPLPYGIEAQGDGFAGDRSKSIGVMLGRHRFHLIKPGWSIVGYLSKVGHQQESGTGYRNPPERVDLWNAVQGCSSHLLRERGRISPQLHDEGIK